MPMVKRRAEAYWVDSTRRWQINVQRDGRRKTFNSSVEGKRGKHECEAKADKWLASQETQQRFATASAEYLAWKKPRVSTGTWAGINGDMRLHVAPRIGNKWLHQITQYDWQSCIDDMARGGSKEGSMRRVVANISNFCDYCKSRLWEITPPRALDVSAGAPAKEKRALHVDEIQKLLHATEADGHFVYMFQFLMFTGLRRGECIGLEQGDIDIAARAVHIRRAINVQREETAGKTGNAQRTVGLTAAAIDVLAAQKKLMARYGVVSKYVFSNVAGGFAAPDAVSREWSKFAKLKGIGCTLHELRHTYISVVKADMPLALLKETVGHSVNMDTIKTYGSYVDGEAAIAAEIADKAFARVIDMNKTSAIACAGVESK